MNIEFGPRLLIIYRVCLNVLGGKIILLLIIKPVCFKCAIGGKIILLLIIKPVCLNALGGKIILF